MKMTLAAALAAAALSGTTAVQAQDPAPLKIGIVTFADKANVVVDPVAVEVTRDNARANGVGPLVRAVTADGLANPILAGGAPYDLLIANILAGPLTQLAPSIQRALAPG